MQKKFAYRVKDRKGLAQNGVMTAESEIAVATSLRKQGFYITQILERKPNLLQQDITIFNKGITAADLSLFARQFSVMIDAGLPLLTVLNVLVEQTEQKQLKEALISILEDVQVGEALAAAMGKYPKVFPVIMVSLVEAGELAGVLNEVMARLATHLEQEHKMRQKLKGALIYPAVVMVFALVVVTIIIVFVLPTFEQIFAGAGIQLPISTQLLLNVSKFIRQHCIAVPLAIIATFVCMYYALALEKLRPYVDVLKLKMPIWGDIACKISIARFCRTLGTLLHGGIMLLPALAVVKKVTGNSVITDAVSNAEISIKEGQGLAAPLIGSGVFPSMPVRMISIGEETGELDQMLEKIAEFYESEIEDKLNNFSKLIEPMLIVFLAVVIGFIAVAIMTPLFEISATIR